jgi:hypothetical protein
MEIKPLDQTVKNLLEGAFYRIPRFQRPYSWDEENVAEFWSDAITSEDQSYFIGSFVLYSRSGASDIYHVVDGQQRLTTITLLLAALRDAFQALTEEAKARGIQKLIERENIENDLEFVLQTESSYPYFHDHIQRFGAPETKVTLGGEERALQRAYQFLSRQVNQALHAIDLDSTIPDTERPRLKGAKLQAIRDKLLNLQLITIRLDNEDDAYIIFETLNTRGKDLTVSDLVKNHLTRQLRPQNRAMDVPRDKWVAINVIFDQSEANISINRFLHHQWISKYPYITEKKLFRQIKKIVQKDDAMRYLDELLADAKRYRKISEPISVRWPRQQARIGAALEALTQFRVAQPIPMLLALLRAYDTSHLSLKQLRSVLEAMERFHVQFTAVTQQRTGGGTALMYASTARQLFEARGKDAAGQVLKDFVGKLRERVPAYAEFEAGFLALAFSDANTRQRGVVRYLLRAMDRHLRSERVDYSTMSIEHISPQSAADRVGVDDDHMAMIGNLVLVDDDLHKRLGVKPFSRKRQILAGAGVPLDESIRAASAWTDKEIEARTKMLATVAYREVFAL